MWTNKQTNNQTNKQANGPKCNTLSSGEDNCRVHRTPYPIQSWGNGHGKSLLNSCFAFQSMISIDFVHEPCITVMMITTQHYALPYLSERRISNSYSALREWDGVDADSPSFSHSYSAFRAWICCLSAVKQVLESTKKATCVLVFKYIIQLK